MSPLGIQLQLCKDLATSTHPPLIACLPGARLHPPARPPAHTPLGGRPHPPTPALTCSLLASHVTDSTMSGRHLGLGGGGRARLNQASAAAVNLELIRRWCHLHRSHRRLRCRRRRRRRPGRRRPERPLPPPQLPVLREGRALLQLPDALQLMCNELPTLQSVSSTEQQPGNAAAGRHRMYPSRQNFDIEDEYRTRYR